MPDDHDQRMQRALASLEGLALGDAFGERFFRPPEELAEMLVQRRLPEGPWGWTDDTAMAVSVVEVLDAHRGIEPDRLARRFANRYALDPTRGYGATAHQLLSAIGQGEPWREVAAAPFDGTGSMGNGSAMRVAPIGAYFADDLDAAVEHARLSAGPTHGHPDAAAGAIAIAVAAAVAARDGAGGREALLREVVARTPAGDTATGIATAVSMGSETTVVDAADKLGNGSSVICRDTVPLCVWLAARHLDDFEEAMWSTVSALGDRDTTCAIVGGIVAAAVGTPGLPSAFLEHREPLDALGLEVGD